MRASWIGLFVSGCLGGSGFHGDGDGDSDTDSDADTDVDADADADTDTDSDADVDSDADADGGGCVGECPDLEGEATGDVTVADGRLSFPYRVTNVGDADATGEIHVKPFLVPKTGSFAHGAGNEGVVLPVAAVPLELAPAESIDRTYDDELPAPIPAGEWLLSAVVDVRNEIEEADELANVTQPIDAGFIEVVGERPTGALDVWSEIEGAVTPQLGGASHTLRTIWNGLGAEFPSDVLFARFMLIDRAGMRIWTMPYEVGFGEVEKQYFALAWQDMETIEGEPIRVDYYWQAPGLEGIPPGDFGFLTLMESHDLLPEVNEANNLDIHPLRIVPVELVGYPDTWFVRIIGAGEPGPKDLAIRNGFEEAVAWTAEVDAAWLTVDVDAGDLGVGEDVTLHVTPDAAGLAIGTYEGEIRIVAAGYEDIPLVIPYLLFVHGGIFPINDTAPTNLDFDFPMNVHPPPDHFTISNPGTADLEWGLWQNQEWISLAPTGGTVPAGDSQDVQVIIHPEGLAAGDYDGEIIVFCSAQNDHPRVSIHATVEWDGYY